MPQSLAPEKLGQAACVRECLNALHECVVQPFGHTVELRGVVHSQASCCASQFEVLVEGVAEVLATAVRPKDFDGSAMLLCQHPHLKGLVHAKSLCLGA